MSGFMDTVHVYFPNWPHENRRKWTVARFGESAWKYRQCWHFGHGFELAWQYRFYLNNHDSPTSIHRRSSFQEIDGMRDLLLTMSVKVRIDFSDDFYDSSSTEPCLLGGGELDKISRRSRSANRAFCCTGLLPSGFILIHRIKGLCGSDSLKNRTRPGGNRIETTRRGALVKYLRGVTPAMRRDMALSDQTLSLAESAGGYALSPYRT